MKNIRSRIGAHYTPVNTFIRPVKQKEKKKLLHSYSTLTRVNTLCHVRDCFSFYLLKVNIFIFEVPLTCASWNNVADVSFFFY